MPKLQKKAANSPKKLLSLSALWVLRAVFFIGIIVTAFQGNIESVAILSAGLVFSFSTILIERRLEIELPVFYELVIVLFIFLTLFLGEVGQAYESLWWYDIALHSSSGVLLGFAGFLVLYVLQRQDKVRISAAMIAFFTFSLGLASAGLWEIIEFTIDSIFGSNLQKGLTDTMSDIIVATVGSAVAAAAAYRYIETPKKSGIRGLVQSFTKENQRLIRKSRK